MIILKFTRGLWVLLLIEALAPQALFAWQWGTEVNCTPWSMPQGFIGCEWFNYQNGWALNNPITFSNWKGRKVIITPYCFMGVLATICSYYDWPDVAIGNGYLNIGDTLGNRTSVQNSRLVNLAHPWQYTQFRTGNCETDNPSSRTMTSCSTPGECLASDEITRLYTAVMIACNGNWENISTDVTYFYNIKPDFSTASGQQYVLSYKFGNTYVPNTSNTYRQSKLYVKSSVTGTSVSYSVLVRAYSWTGSQWGNPVELLNSTFWTNSTTGAFETWAFHFHAPADPIKITCTISHNHSSPVSHRAVLRDFHDEARIEFRCGDTLQSAIIEGGNIELERGEANLPMSGKGVPHTI